MTKNERIEFHNSMVDDKAYIYSVDYYDVENMQLILRYLGHDYDLKSAKAQLDIGRKYL